MGGRQRGGNRGGKRSNGAEGILLHTDLANPVSNSVYQRIGYRPVGDRVMLAFKSG